MIDWDSIPGMIKSGQIKCVGHGEHQHDEHCFMWTLLQVDGHLVLVSEHWDKGDCELTEVSSDFGFDKDEMIALSEAVGDLDRNASPVIEEPCEMNNCHSW